MVRGLQIIKNSTTTAAAKVADRSRYSGAFAKNRGNVKLNR